MTTLIKEYKTRKIKDKERIVRDFDRLDKKKRGELSLRHLRKYLNEDHSLSESDVDNFLDSFDPGIKMNKEQFVDWAYNFGLYGCGKEYMGPFIFGKNYSKFKVVQKKDKNFS